MSHRCTCMNAGFHFLLSRFPAFVLWPRLCGLMMWLMLATALQGQVLTGPWVDQSQQAIAQHRMTDLHVIVVDRENQPLADAMVHVRMLRHDFAWGVHLDREMMREWEAEGPVWRCFNAAALDRVSAWPVMQGEAEQWRERHVENILDWCETRGLQVRFGAVTSAHPAHLPAWVVQLDDPALRDAIETRIRRVLRRFGRRMQQFDLHSHMVDHQLVQARLGRAMIRRMHDEAKAFEPRVQLGVRFENCLTGERLQQMRRKLGELRDDFVPMDVLVLDERLDGLVLQAPLTQAARWLRNADMPVVIGKLEVGGGGAEAAAINLETVLRVLFAEPAITGIYMAGVRGEHFSSDHAALLDAEGRPTPAGRAFDALVRELWWSDETHMADSLGNVRSRVFAGVYQITVTLDDGVVFDTQVYLPVRDESRIVLMQPLMVE